MRMKTIICPNDMRDTRRGSGRKKMKYLGALARDMQPAERLPSETL